MSGEAAAGLYEQVLAALGRETAAAEKPPRPSAAVVPWRRRERRLEVFWVQRSEAVPFMPGWHAFPGGAVGRGDAELPVAGAPVGPPAGAALGEGARGAGEEAGPSLVPGVVPDLVPGVVAAALRELAEETGLLVLAPRGAAADAELLSIACGGEVGALAAALRARDLALDGGGLVFAGRWLTPPFAPLRFDNRFFLLEWPADRQPQPEVVPGELARGEWIEPRAALARWEAGDALAAPPILHLLQVLAEDGPEGGLPRLLDPSEADLGPFRRIEFRPGVVMLPLRTPTLPPATHTNAYLLGTGPAVLVDPGSPWPDEQERLLAAARDAERRLGRRVEAVWLTHHHPDHVGGATALARALGVPIAAHQATTERLAPRAIAVDRTLADGELHELGSGFRVRVVHTPGHARGHLCFHVEGDGALLCGDLFSALSTVVIDPPEGHMGDYLVALARARDLRPRFLLPAHGPVVRDGERALARVIAHREQREGRVLAAWRQGVREPAALVAAAYDELAPGLGPVAERQVLAHIEHLRERGLL